MHRIWLQILVTASLLLPAVGLADPSGKEIHDEMLASVGAYDDPELTAYVEGLVRDIISVSEMAGEDFTFTLLDSGELNAFATADNYVYMNRGLLNYMSNEAELVSVLAHEIGHITQKHVDLMPVAAGGAKFLTWLAATLSGSQEVYSAGMTYADSLLKGHGRDNELEADQAAARYMSALGYDPNEMLEMLTVMKDLEILSKEQAEGRGVPRAYHGIFATHPRNDMRLRSAVSKSRTLEPSDYRDSGAAVFRQMTEGLVWGENFKEKEQKPERYMDRDLKIRFDFPEGWVHASICSWMSLPLGPAKLPPGISSAMTTRMRSPIRCKSAPLLGEIGLELVAQTCARFTFDPGQQRNRRAEADHVGGPLGIDPYPGFLGQVPQVPHDRFEHGFLVPGRVAPAARGHGPEPALHRAVHAVRLDFAIQPHQVNDPFLAHFFLDDRFLHEPFQPFEVLGRGSGLEPGVEHIDETFFAHHLEVRIGQMFAQALHEAAIGFIVPGIAPAQDRHLVALPDIDRFGRGPIVVNGGDGTAPAQRDGRRHDKKCCMFHDSSLASSRCLSQPKTAGIR